MIEESSEVILLPLWLFQLTCNLIQLWLRNKKWKRLTCVKDKTKSEEEDRKINLDNNKCKKTSKICKCNKCKVETPGKNSATITTWLTRWKSNLIITSTDHLRQF